MFHGKVVNKFMLLAMFGWLLIMRKVFAKHPIGEEAMTWFMNDAEQQVVLGNVQVSSIDDGRIQFFHLTLMYLNDESEKSVACKIKLVFLLFNCSKKNFNLCYCNFFMSFCVMSPKYC